MLKTGKALTFLFDMDLTANPACKIDVILDEATGDIIKGRGNGILNIKVGTREAPTIRGRYDITDGEYKFNFQTFYKSILPLPMVHWYGMETHIWPKLILMQNILPLMLI